MRVPGCQLRARVANPDSGATRSIPPQPTMPAHLRPSRTPRLPVIPPIRPRLMPMDAEGGDSPTHERRLRLGPSMNGRVGPEGTQEGGEYGRPEVGQACWLRRNGSWCTAVRIGDPGARTGTRPTTRERPAPQSGPCHEGPDPRGGSASGDVTNHEARRGEVGLTSRSSPT